MCGIAGLLDLRGSRPVPHHAIEAMAQALVHRGPDEHGFLEQPGLALASRRLSIIGLSDGRQPIANEDGSVMVVFNGELFDYPERRAELEGHGHHFATHCDTELIPHLWEEHGEAMFERLRGQFAIALWDRHRQRLYLARDRFGICPLYWTRQTTASGDWLLFASEIKALLASGLVPARPDLRGIDHAFTFFAFPGPRTAFADITALLPGHYLCIQLGDEGQSARAVIDRVYWQMDFPDRGQEEPGHNSQRVIDEFEDLLLAGVERRLRADVPVVSYLSGGVDSSIVVALAGHARGRAIPTFTIRIEDPALDETAEAEVVSRYLGSVGNRLGTTSAASDPATHTVVSCGAAEVLETYPRLVEVAESPVIDTSCAALLLLAEEVHRQGYKVALTGEGADEWLAGYPWYKVHKLLSFLDLVPGLPLSPQVRRAYLWLTDAPRFPWSVVHRIRETVGGSNAWLEVYGLMSLSRPRFYSSQMRETLAGYTAYEDLCLNTDRMRRWHPLNRSIYLGARIHLPGLLLNAKGDRVAMHSSVETRYPFLDEAVFDYLARLHPRWKLRGFREKLLLRRLAQRWLPPQIAWRRKAMFRAPFDSFHGDHQPAFIEQLLSEESLRKTGYFDPAAVRTWRSAFRRLRQGSSHRTTLEMGLSGVVSTQLWHHLFIDGSLAGLPSHAASWKSGAAEHAAARPRVGQAAYH
jgi:asparagine synthase (glutamine-hydrolysing)